MNARVLALAAACAAVVLAVGVLLVSRRAPADEAPVAAAVPAAAPDAPAAPPAEPDTAAPAPAPRPRAERVDPSPAPVGAAPEPVAPAPTAGTLHIDADVAGAQVFIDRQFIGATPVTASNVTPGTHQLNVSAEGFDGIARSIEVEPGARDLMIRFREVRLDARLAVIHKHRLGSCQGELVATPQGLQYQTDNKDDAFSAPLTNLDEFRVDYQDKNLRVKLGGGRQYNFTDPEGDADRLFVFHRDVDRARQRLAGGDRPASN